VGESQDCRELGIAAREMTIVGQGSAR